MAVQFQGNNGVVAEVDGTVFRAWRTTPRPVDYGALGSYQVSLVSGTMAAALAANSDVFQFRWAPGDSRLAIIHRVVLEGMYQITGFTAGAGLFRMGVARAWTADGSGGTAATLTGENAQLRTAMAASAATARISTTAALTAGTKTYDTNDIASYVKFILAAANTQVFEPIDLFNPDVACGEHPLVLANQEGFGIRATVPATGTWSFGVRVHWSEVTAY